MSVSFYHIYKSLELHGLILKQQISFLQEFHYELASRLHQHEFPQNTLYISPDFTNHLNLPLNFGKTLEKFIYCKIKHLSTIKALDMMMLT